MWSARILSGSQAGQFIDLKMGRNLVGRAAHCDIKILSQGISKEHCEIHVYSDKVMVVDLRSSNGTFVNGIRVQNGLVRMGDKISVHDVLLDILPRPDIKPSRSMVTATGHTSAQMPAEYSQNYQQGNLANSIPPHQFPQDTSPSGVGQPLAQNNLNSVQNLLTQFNDYVERVALPGVYKLAEITDLKTLLALFIAIFVFSVTILSMFPMMQITKDSIITESLRRASSLARSVALANQEAFLQKNYVAMNTHSVETEEGVKQAVIIDQLDGSIVAPANRQGRSLDIPFVVRARREIKAMTEQIDSNTIGASYPIGMYDPNTGEPSVKAYAIVIYDISSLGFDTGRAISLFMQTILIASVIGFFLFYFMYQLIEFPIRTLNHKLDLAMRESTDDIRIKFQFPVLQQLIGNVNSLLTRSLNGAHQNAAPTQGKEAEAENLIQMIMLPSLAVHNSGALICSNERFEPFARSTAAQLRGQSISAIGDNSLRQNIEYLIQKCRDNPFSIHSDKLEFSGQACQIHAQAFSTAGHIDYFLITITPNEGATE